MEMDINELVEKSGVPRRTIHFYVQQGLLPAAAGAGLAARYTDDHLIRLAAIPVLRRRGMRLDEIRREFQHTSRAQLEALLQDERSERQEAEKRLWQAQSLLRYTLAPGVELVVDTRADAATRKQVLRLLEQASIIFEH
ncbi:MAG TPA: MerR family transcriptional regulator [bacterium]|nr:MerR family transcriptional regulator [bacterium]HPR86752.1 MerR family transcriptional regulator [bacterium]